MFPLWNCLFSLKEIVSTSAYLSYFLSYFLQALENSPQQQEPVNFDHSSSEHDETFVDDFSDSDSFSGNAVDDFSYSDSRR